MSDAAYPIARPHSIASAVAVGGRSSASARAAPGRRRKKSRYIAQANSISNSPSSNDAGQPGEPVVEGDHEAQGGDGVAEASEFRIFFRLILPLGLPAVASLAIFQFLWTWNDLIVALTLIAPASFISLAIPLVLFLAFQRYFVQGLLAGSVT